MLDANNGDQDKPKESSSLDMNDTALTIRLNSLRRSVPVTISRAD